LDYLDPFLLLDHFGSDNPDDYIAGFPMHPHRGIETVTYMLSGAVKHKDSLGNEGVIESGDIQWMTAGSGIMHEEMPLLRDGKMEGFQLWVNLPAKLKMIDPRYQEVPANKIPVLHEDGIEIKIIAGNYHGVSGAVNDIYIDPTYLDIRMPANKAFRYQLPEDFSVFAYLYFGNALCGGDDGNDGNDISSPQLVVFDQGQYLQIKTSHSNANFILVSGKPLNEPIARYQNDPDLSHS